MDYYKIIVKGHIAEYWSESLGGLKISQMSNGETMLSGDIVDQAQLHGILNRIRDMGLTLVEVHKNHGSSAGA
jgi:hypothetical protein